MVDYNEYVPLLICSTAGIPDMLDRLLLYNNVMVMQDVFGDRIGGKRGI